MRNRTSPIWLVALMLCATGAAAEPDTFGLGTGRDGVLTVSEPRMIINRYTQVTGPLAPGDRLVWVSSVEGFTEGDLVMVLQTTGIVPEPPRGEAGPVVLRDDPVGRWELARVASVLEGELKLKAPLVHSYAGRVTQVIRVPEYTEVTVRPGASLAAQPWNGETGGVLVLLATGTVRNEGEIQASGAGFRGGPASQEPMDLIGCSLVPREVRPGARRGEGISVLGYGPWETGLDNASNGGGGGICPMSGGGGGGNGGAGGRGGDSSAPWDVSHDIGGRGGAALRYSLFDHLTLGGGGGKGHGQDESGSSAGTGGGAIFIRANALKGSGAILAQGEAGGSVSGSGAGGGGAGGSIYLRLVGSAGCGSISARGGEGGSALEAALLQAGAGGGGGGGRVLYQAASTDDSCAINVDAGLAGSRTAIGASARTGVQAQPTAGNQAPHQGVIQRVNKGFSVTSNTNLVPPETTIVTAPPNPTNQTTAAFTFTGAGAGGKYWCRLSLETVGDFVDCGAAGSDGGGEITYASLGGGIYTFEVYAEDAAGNKDPDPQRFIWEIDLTPPTTTIATHPPNPTNQTTAVFTFTGAGTGGKYWCREWMGTASGQYLDCGVAGSGGDGDAGTKTFTSLAVGSHTFEVYAQDALGNVETPAKQFTWVIDRTPPTTTIATHPPDPTNQTTAEFTFTGAGAGGNYWCREWKGTAGGQFLDCGAAGSGGDGDTGKTTFTNLTAGSHTFEVYAVDAAGNTETPAKQFTWVIDLTPPTTTILTAPPNPTNQTTAAFTFTGAGAGGKYWCRLSSGTVGDFVDCGAAGSDGGGEITYASLGGGIYTFEVYAEDAAGNKDPDPQQFIWEIDLTPPTTTIATHPPNPTNQTTAVFTFTGAGTGGKYWCREWMGTASGQYLDCGAAGSGGPGDTGAKTFTNLTAGSHTFEIYAVDAAGNTETPAKQFTWVIDLTPPDTVIVNHPQDPTNQTTAEFTFTGAGVGGKYWCRLAGPGAVFEDCGAAGSGGPGDTGKKVLSGLTKGLNTFQVYAEDAAGNMDSGPAEFPWVVDTDAPETTIATSPQNPTSSRTAEFTFTGAGAGGKYWCRMWAVPPAPAFTNCGAAGSGGLGDTGKVSYSSLADNTYTFEVYAEDAAGNTDQSPAQFFWTVDGTVPETHLQVNSPSSSPTSQRSAVFTFSGAGTGGQYWCREWKGATDGGAFQNCGAAGSGGSPDLATKSYADLPDGDHTFEVYAEDEAHNKDDQSPEQYKWTVDTVAPDTKITSQPSNPSNHTTDKIEFSANEEGLSYFCSLDDSTNFSPCTSPYNMTNLTEFPSPHSFCVYAKDGAGNSEGVLGDACVTWVVDLTPPETTIAQGPPSLTNNPDATFSFSSNEAGVTYWCVLDNLSKAACANPATFPGLKDGPHDLYVTAKDTAGNEDPSAAPYHWTIDTKKPITKITDSPPKLDNHATATFIFDAGESGAIYKCSLDSPTFVECSSPQVYSSLGETPNPHVFRVYATDAAGNTEADAARYEWTVDTTPPDPPDVVQPFEGQCTNSNTINVKGTAESLATVTVFLEGFPETTSTTAADGLKNWSVGVFIGDLGNGTYKIGAKAKDAAGNTGANSSDRSFIRDTIPPDTGFEEKPPTLSNSKHAIFKFNSTEEGVHYKCSLDGSPFADCSNGLELDNLTDGSHTLAVIAVDCAGNDDPTPAVYQWVVDTIAPIVTITSPKEGDEVGEASPSVTGTSEKSALVQVVVTAGDLQMPPMKATVTVGPDNTWSFQFPRAVSNGTYTASATATDLAGNTGATVIVSFKIDTTPPDTEIIKGPPPIDIHDSAEFVFQSSKGGSDFEFCLDKDPQEDETCWTKCTFKYQTPHLPDGDHFLVVRAVDSANNKGPPTPPYPWTIIAEIPGPPEFTGPLDGTVVHSLTPTIVGTTISNGTVDLFIDKETIDDETQPSAIATADKDGNFTYTISTEMAERPHILVGQTTNIYNNKSKLSNQLSFTVVAPKAQAKSMGGGIGCASASASPWLALLGLLAGTLGRARRRRSQ